MATVQRLGPGTLTIGDTNNGGVDVSCQITRGRLVPSFETGDNETTLCGDEVPGEQTTSWALDVELFQDWTEDGINAYCYEHDGETQEFTFTPDDGGTEFTGELVVRALPIGGETRQRLKAEAEFPCVGKPVAQWETSGV